jgi:hypothetical protein
MTLDEALCAICLENPYSIWFNHLSSEAIPEDGKVIDEYIYMKENGNFSEKELNARLETIIEFDGKMVFIFTV